jgi:hypothetical protein
VRHSFDGRALRLILGAVVSMPVVFLFGRQIMLDATEPGRRSWSVFTLGLLVVVPYGLALYLTFYEGLWSAWALFTSFSLASLCARVVFLFLGYRLATWLMHLTNIPGQLKSGRVIVMDPPIKHRSR